MNNIGKMLTLNITRTMLENRDGVYRPIPLQDQDEKITNQIIDEIVAAEVSKKNHTGTILVSFEGKQILRESVRGKLNDIKVQMNTPEDKQTELQKKLNEILNAHKAIPMTKEKYEHDMAALFDEHFEYRVFPKRI